MRIARALLMTLLPALAVLAQSDPASASPAATPGQATPTFRSETNLVSVRVEGFLGAFEKVIQSVRDQIQYGYAAGFYAPSSGERKAHRIQVVLKDTGHGKLAGNARMIVH